MADEMTGWKGATIASCGWTAEKLLMKITWQKPME